MQYRSFGSTGMQVSALGYGAMRLPGDEQEAVALIQRGIDLGINYIDSAHGYSIAKVEDRPEVKSETIVGRAIKGRRDQVHVATKLPCIERDWQKFEWGVEESLRRFDTEYIDLFQMHGLTWENYENFALRPDGPLEALQKAKERGQIRHIGFSSHDKPENMIRLLDTGHFESILLQYNLLDRDANGPVIAHAHARGLGVAVMGPLGGGRLGGRSQVIQEMLPGGQLSTAEVGLRFVLANPGVCVALSGMNAMSQIEENCRVASRPEPLSDAERARIEEALVENAKLRDLYCTGCAYCMPCPHGVNIPKNLSAQISAKVWGLVEAAKRQYQRLPEPERAAMCQQCNECLEKCPQRLQIPEELEEIAKTLGAP